MRIPGELLHLHRYKRYNFNKFLIGNNMLFEIIKFLLIILIMIYAFFFVFGLICVIIIKDKDGIKQYLLFSPSLIWILPLAASRVIYRLITGKEWKKTNHVPNAAEK